MMMKAIWRKEKGFTLIELLIVVAIIGILAGIAVPRISESMNSAKESACLANMDALESAAEMYRFEEDGNYPEDLNDLVPTYLREFPECPDEGDYEMDENGVVTCTIHSIEEDEPEE